MKIKRFNENINESKTKVLYISGDDYAKLSFENKYNGTPVIDIINDLESFKSTPDDETYWELEVYEFENIDPKFAKFVRITIQDYDDSKHHGFYLENENIGETNPS